MKVRVEIDATSLTYGAFILPGVKADALIDGRSVQVLDLEPGSYTIYVGSGLLIAAFSVSATRIIDYDTRFERSVRGRGSNRLTIIGFKVRIDGRQLDGPGFILMQVSNVGEDKTHTSQADVTLCVTTYQIRQQSLPIDCSFSVESDGMVNYPSRYDQTYGGFLAGHGTNTLILLGYAISVDGTALSYSSYAIPGMTKNFVDRNAILTLRLLPDSYIFQCPGSGYADFSFRVTSAGEIDFDPAFDGFLAGRGTRSLEIRGHQISINAASLMRPIFLFALDKWISVADLRLVPGSYSFMDSVSGVGDGRFRIDAGGRFNYDADLDVKNGGYLTGLGTRQLSFIGYPLVVDMASMGAGVDIGGMHIPFEPDAPIQKVYLLPKNGIEFRVNRTPPLNATLNVSVKGITNVTGPPDLDLRREREQTILKLLGNSSAEYPINAGGNMTTTNTEPLIKLDPSGTAPVLSYNVPEPTSYVGRNFIDLQFDKALFREDVRLTSKGSDVMPGGAGTRAAAKQIGDLAENRPGDGRSHIYRSIYGTAFEVKASTALRAMKRDDQRRDEPDLSSGPHDPLLVLVDIEAPTAGQTMTGPSSGVRLDVRIAADVDSGPGYITGVKVKVGDQVPQPATFASGRWTYAASVSTPGQLTLRVTASHSGGREFSEDAKVFVQLTAPPVTEATDTTPPQLSISYPRGGEAIEATGESANLQVAGNASDPSGVATVEIYLDGATTPIASETTNAWATWTTALKSVPAGAHSIMVRCVDNAGNVTKQTVPFSIRASGAPKLLAARLLLVETLKLSSFTGNYGAGRTIKTFSLLPGEKTKISIKTYTRTTIDAKQASSILDSFTQESADDFEKAVEHEQAYKENYDDSFKWSVHGEASASWGWGSAKIDAGVSGGTNAAREETAKNISKATQKHAAKASAKRDIQINTSYEVKSETGEETAIERVIENVNVSRTLNFVFRQMNQEFLTVLHLLDVRVGYLAIYGDAPGQQTYKEVSLPQLDSLLQEVIVPDPKMIQKVRASVVHQLENIFDYRDIKHCFIEERPLDPLDANSSYLRIKKDYVSTHHDPATGTEVTVPGIILSVDKHVMRTEGVIVESLLGQGQGLDDYSRGLQDEAIRDRKLKNDLQAAELTKINEAIKIAQAKDSGAAAVFDSLFGVKQVAK